MATYSYVLKEDYGLAPNPFGEICTLAVCKSPIRKKVKQEARPYILGFGSSNVKLETDNPTNRFYKKLVFAMKVTQVLTMKEYDAFCKKNLPIKIPKESDDWRTMCGDCIYDFTKMLNGEPEQRKCLHCKNDIKGDLDGENVLLSDNFYYFGIAALKLPADYNSIIKTGIGYTKYDDDTLTEKLFKWLAETRKDQRGTPEKDIFPQLKWAIKNKFGNSK